MSKKKDTDKTKKAEKAKAKPAKAPAKKAEKKAAKNPAQNAPQPEQATPQQPQQEAGGLPLTIHAQYVRDISFENPLAPQALRGGQPTPQMNVNFGMDARKMVEEGLGDLYEVIVTINAEAKRDDAVIFIAEIQYGVTVSVGDAVPEEQIHPLLLIEVPRLAFPFVRQIMADLTVQGGYPPLLLAPVNFHQLYMERFKDQLAAAQQAGTT